MSFLHQRLSGEDIAAVIDVPFEDWAGNCHGISHAIVQAGIWSPSRVARGWAKGVCGQHSWVVVGSDCYAEDAQIVDPTLWSYDKTVEGVWYGTAGDDRHWPHGVGSIWDYGKPADATEPVIDLAVAVSPLAREFLKLAGPNGLDRRGWSTLAHSPVGGWPAAEIIAAMDDTPELSFIVPIDKLGMLTDRNPRGLYLPRKETT